MRYIVAFIVVILGFEGQIFAQERDTLIAPITYPGKPGIFPELPGTIMPDESAPVPFLYQELNNDFGLQNSAFPNINFNLTNNNRKTETGTLMGLRSINGYNPIGLYGRSVWDIYQGTYGIRAYQLNNKLFVATAGYSEKSFNEYSLRSGIYRQTNYSSSLFVGYKFSEKFSISAGFTIRRNGDPLNRNSGIQNGAMFP